MNKCSWLVNWNELYWLSILVNWNSLHNFDNSWLRLLLGHWLHLDWLSNNLMWLIDLVNNWHLHLLLWKLDLPWHHLLNLSLLLWGQILLLLVGHLDGHIQFFLVLVGLLVAVKVELGEETSVADLASESLVTSVDLNMLVKVSFLSERQTATWVVALVWSLVGVDTEMVKEVVPFSEHFSASLMSAAQESDHSSSVWASVFNDNKVLGFWNVLVDSNLVEIKFLSILNDDMWILWKSLLLVLLRVSLNIEIVDFLNFTESHYLVLLFLIDCFAALLLRLFLFGVADAPRSRNCALGNSLGIFVAGGF